MGRTRVLIADDSATARFLLVSLCRRDPRVEVVGEASNGDEAVAMTLRLRPDLVVMDVHMPGVDGFTATRRIMVAQPTPVLVVTATVRPEDVDLALRAVEAGAVAIAQKPPGPDDPGYEREAGAFLRKVTNLAQVTVIRRYETHRRQRPPSAKATGRVQAVGVAASTGGPLAVRDLLRALPAGFAAPVALVQHIAEGFGPGFARWLEAGVLLTVKVAEHGEPFTSGRVYLAPDDRHLVVARDGTVVLDDAPAVAGFRPSASVLFASLAEVYGARAAGVILTGLGTDGLTGLQALSEAGGCVLAQDPATAVAASMPGSVVRAGLPDLVATPQELGTHLARICTSGDGS